FPPSRPLGAPEGQRKGPRGGAWQAWRSGVTAGAKRYVRVPGGGAKVLTGGGDLADAPLHQEIQGPVQHHPDLVPEADQLGEIEAPPDEPRQRARPPDPQQLDGSEVLAHRDQGAIVEVAERLQGLSPDQTNEVAPRVGPLLEGHLTERRQRLSLVLG